MECKKRAREDTKESSAAVYCTRDPEPVILLMLQAFDKNVHVYKQSEKEYNCQVFFVNEEGNKEVLIEVNGETEEGTLQTTKEMLCEWIREWYSKCQSPPPGLGWFVFPD